MAIKHKLTKALEYREKVPDSSSASQGSSASTEHTLVEYGHWILSLGVMYAGNKGIAQATAAAGISFPSPLIGNLRGNYKSNLCLPHKLKASLIDSGGISPFSPQSCP